MAKEQNTENKSFARFHLPGLFEFYDLYKAFFALFFEHREYFHDWVEISSLYGAPADCLWGGGRVGYGSDDTDKVFSLINEYGISGRLTFSNSLLNEEHLKDKRCNELCKRLERLNGNMNGVIVHSDLLANYISRNYPGLILTSSTTKVITDYDEFVKEVNRPEFEYVVPDFRFNNDFSRLDNLDMDLREKLEFLCNECCFPGCTKRALCYENVSRMVLGEECIDHVCAFPGDDKRYRFSRAMKSPLFIGIDDIKNKYLPRGFYNFKIEGRSLGSAMVFEFLLYYLVKPEYMMEVREEIYLDSSLDLF